MFGALAWVAWVARDSIPHRQRVGLLGWIAPCIVVNLLIGMGPGIDNAAHVGGLLGGVLTAMFLMSCPGQDLIHSRNGNRLLLLIGLLPFVNEVEVVRYAWQHAQGLLSPILFRGG